jgi:hypothetical protein
VTSTQIPIPGDRLKMSVELINPAAIKEVCFVDTKVKQLPSWEAS